MKRTIVPIGVPRLFEKADVTARDQTVFAFKLVVALSLVAAGAVLALRDAWAWRAAGTLLLGAVYTHMVELQHQCLHHSAFRAAHWHRIVGVPLGMPLLVSYSHYRVRHLQHHRWLGTPRDSEFFGFDTRKPLTWGGLLRATFDYGRLWTVLQEIVRSVRGDWQYDKAQISERRRLEISSEYRWMAWLIVTAVALSCTGFLPLVLKLWILPLVVAIPMHFLVELPEHVLCDTETTDVLRNTRSIRGTWFSTWFTNGNNLHVEHHAAMAVPINRLRERHPHVKVAAKHVERSYLDFFLLVLREAQRNSRHATTNVSPPSRAS